MDKKPVAVEAMEIESNDAKIKNEPKDAKVAKVNTESKGAQL